MIFQFFEKLHRLIVLVQGSYFYLKMKKLPDPLGKRIATLGQGETSIRILVVGDSSALGVGCPTIEETTIGTLAQQLSSNYKIYYQVCAFTGYTTAQVIDEVKKIPQTNFDYIILSLGSNDIVKGTKFHIWQIHNNDLCQYLVNTFNTSKLFISAVPPFQKLHTVPKVMRNYLAAKSLQMNQHLKSLVTTHVEYEYIDLDFEFYPHYVSDDGFHPSASLYHIQGKRLANLIQQDVAIDKNTI